jgi:uncharacterized protein YdcH (DUF465 family)
MSHVPHALPEEFPDDVALLSRLEREDAHMARLAEAYHDVNRDIHRAETDVEPCSDQHMVEMRKRRLALKDEISGILSRARVGA